MSFTSMIDRTTQYHASSYRKATTINGVVDATHEIGALHSLLLVIILGMCILAAYLIKQYKFYYISASTAAIVVGMVVGLLIRAVYPNEEELKLFSFDNFESFFFFVLLPPIIFEAGYSLQKLSFFANIWTIALFAVIGTIITAFSIGYFVYIAGVLGFVHISHDPMEALLYGSLLSSIDPVAVLSLLGNAELNVDTLLYSLVFGESVLNDAVSIVLFNTFKAAYASGETFSSKTVATVLINFSSSSFYSLIVGVATGLLCSYVCKHTQIRKWPEYEISILFLFAYGSYAFSEALQLSGIMSLFFCGVVLSHYNTHNLSSTSQVSAHNIFKSLAILCEFFIFLFIGLGIFTGRFRHFNFSFFVLTFLLCYASRFLNVFPLSAVANRFRRNAIPVKMQVVMWFAGLRGAVSFALSMQLPGEHRDLYISTTLSIVIFTTVFCGGLTEPVLTRMGMRRARQQSANTLSVVALDEPFLPADEVNGNQKDIIIESDEYVPSSNDALNCLSCLRGVHVHSHRPLSTQTRSFLEKLDKDFMSPIFGGPAPSRALNIDTEQ